MYFITSICLAILLTFTSGSPLGSRSLNVNLISCPRDSIILDQFRASSPCSVFCLRDDDCGASGLSCCSTGCGTRCVAEAILAQATSGNDDQQSPERESMIDKQLAVLKEKLDEKRKEEESNLFTLENEDDSEEDEVTNETTIDEEEEEEEEEEEGSDEEEEQLEDEMEDEEEDEEEEEEVSPTPSPEDEEVSPTPSPSIQESSTSTIDMDSNEDDNDEDDNSDEYNDDDGDEDHVLAGEDDDGTEFEDYSYDEEAAEEDLEYLLMKLLLALKNKQNSRRSPWSDIVHNSRSLLEDSKDHSFKSDFFINALPPADALKSDAVDEGKRELEGPMEGFFHDEPFKREDIAYQGATGRRSSMERREKLAREVDQEDSPNLTNELINASNMMR